MGGGGGAHPDFFWKLDFEVAVDQQTKAHDQTFEGVPDSGFSPVSAGQPRPHLVNFWLNFAKSLEHVQNHALGCSTEHKYKVLSKLDKNWLSYEQNSICPYLDIRTKYDRFRPIN